MNEGNIHSSTRQARFMFPLVMEETDVDKIRFDLIKWKMNNSPEIGLTKNEIEIAIEEYKRFLTLKIRNPKTSLSPTSLMDKVWHMHILDTKRYAADCERMFGKFLHHDPSYREFDSTQRTAELANAFESMKSLYSLMYGHDPISAQASCNTDDDGSICSGVDCCDG
jgi:hypothetical protein